MARRYLNAHQIRELIIARKTKGAAFMGTHDEYERLMATTREEIYSQEIEYLLRGYPHYLYDVSWNGKGE